MKKTLPILFLAATLFWMTSALAFEAYDDGWQSVYEPETVTSWIGLNGGTNYTPWTLVGDADRQGVTTDFEDASAAGATNDGDFTLGVKSGEAVVRRNFEDENGMVVLGTGTFTVRSWLYAKDGEFVGFALLDAMNNELVRWGMNSEGFVYKTADGEYQLLESGDWNTYLDTTMEWEGLNGELALRLSGSVPGWNSQEVPTDWSGTQIAVSGADSVGGIAVIAGGGTSASPAKLSFDRVNTTGIIVPEPGTLGLLAAGVVGLLARRRRRG